MALSCSGEMSATGRIDIVLATTSAIVLSDVSVVSSCAKLPMTKNKNRKTGRNFVEPMVSRLIEYKGFLLQESLKC